MNHQLGMRPLAQLPGEPEMVGMNVGDEDSADAVDWNSNRIQLLIERRPRLVGLQAGIDQGVAVAVTQQKDVDVPELERHGELEAKDARGDFHSAEIRLRAGRVPRVGSAAASVPGPWWAGAGGPYPWKSCRGRRPRLGDRNANR